MIDKETITNPIEIKKSSCIKIQTLEKGTNIGPIDIKNKKNILILKPYQPINLQPTKDEGSKTKHKIQGCLIVILIIIIIVLFNILTRDEINMRSYVKILLY
jgi:hypothetical protein